MPRVASHFFVSIFSKAAYSGVRKSQCGGSWGMIPLLGAFAICAFRLASMPARTLGSRIAARSGVIGSQRSFTTPSGMAL